MKLLMNTLQSLVIDMSINLGGGDISVAEEFLDDAEIGSILKEVGGEGVTQQVGIHVLLDPGQLGAGFDDLTNPIGTECSSPHRKEDLGGGVGFDMIGTLVGEVAFQRDAGPSSDRNDARLVPFTGDANEAVVKIESLQTHGTNFGQAQPGRIEELQDGEVAPTEGFGRIDGLE